MPRYVALFRGINVGKAKRVAMADLRELLGELGYSEVATLLNSGNAVFTGQVSGDRVRLTRRSEHTFSSVWTADEVIEGRLVGERGSCQRLDAAYSYTECDTANRSQCPGHCRIGSPVTIR